MTGSDSLSSIHIEPLFPTPMIVETVGDHDVQRGAIVAALTAAAMGDKRRAEAWARTGPGEWSNTLAGLIRHIGALATRMSADVAKPDRPARWQTKTGVQVADRDDHVDLPRSYDAFWSAIYIANDGYEGSRDPALGGELVMHDPRLPATMMEMAELRLRLSTSQPKAVYAPEIVVRPATGYLLLYPGWLRVTYRPLRHPGRRMMVTASLIAPI